MINKIFAALFFVMISLPNYSFANKMPVYEVVKNKSVIKFFAIHDNKPLQGKFNNYTANIQFDPEKAGKSLIEVEVDMSSIEIGDEEANKAARLPQWLSVIDFPKAAFKSTYINRMPMTDKYYGDGELTIRDVTMPVTINFQLRKSVGGVAVVKGFMTLRRSDFGVGQGKWAKDDVVKDEVRVEFRILANKQ